MTPNHYTYPTILPQHAGPSFFTDQLAHLEMVVAEMKPKLPSIPRYTLPFEETVAGKTLDYLTNNPNFIAYRELGPHLGISRKSAATAINNLRKMGYKFDEQTRNQVVFVRLKITE